MNRKLPDTIWDHVTHWTVGGIILIITGLAPEEWLASIFDSVHHNIRRVGLDYHSLIMLLGIAIIGSDVWRRRRFGRLNGFLEIHETGIDDIYYQRVFASPPNLRISCNKWVHHKLVEQRTNGFKIEISAYSSGSILNWDARGTFAKKVGES